MKRTLWVPLAAIAAIAACNGAKKDEGAAPAASGGKGGRGGKGAGLVFAADVLPVESKKVSYVVAAPGVIDAFERVQVTARVAGAVDKVGFGEGATVKAGDTLVVIDASRYQVAVDSAQAALDKAVASQKDSEAMANRRTKATDDHPGLIPDEELRTYQTKALTAKADTQVAAQAVKTAQLNLRDSYVRAPIDGVIQTRTVETGQYVAPGYVMATLLRSDPMLLRFNVEPSDAPRITPGMVANFTMRETQRTYAAKISLVAGAADTTTHMVPVTAELTDKDHKYWLRPGSFCDVNITLDNQDRISPVIPRSAARATDHGYVAYVVQGDVAHERQVSLGMNTTDGWVEVRSGIQAGDLLVVHGAEALTEGAKVKATQTTAAALMAAAGDAGAATTPAPPPTAATTLAGNDAHDGGAGHHARPADSAGSP